MQTIYHRCETSQPCRLTTRIMLLLGCSMFWLLSLDPILAQTLPNSRYEVLVRNGDTVPGSSETFTFLGNPVASHDGQWAVFEGDYTGTVGRGLFRVSLSDGTVTQVIADNDPLSGGNYSMGVGGIQLSVNSSGTVGFNAKLVNTGSTTNDSGIYTWNGSSVTKLVREGDTAPGGSGGTFLSFGTGLLDAQFRGLNDQGQTMFSDNISNSPNNPNDDWRYFRVSNSGLPEAIATEGDSAPNGGLYLTFGFPEMNDQGQAVVQSATSQSNLGTKLYRMDADGSMHELVNAHSTGTPVGSLGTLRAYGGNASINNLGEVAFIGWTTSAGINPDDTHLIKLSPTGNLTVVLTEGTAAPGGNGEFKNMTHLNPRFNDAGQYASGFALRNTNGGGSDDTGIFRVNADGSVTQIFREGQMALNGNGNFGNISTSASFAFNNAGMVAMETTYINTLNGGSDNLAIVVSDGIDSFEVAREGNTVGGLTVLDLEFNGGVYGNDRSTSGLNQYGQVLYYQGLSSGNRALVLWTPELHHRGGNSDFGDGQNWTLSLTPGQVHDVFLDSSTSSMVSVNGSHTVNNLQVGGGGAAQLHMLGNSDITVNQTLRLDANGSIVMDNNTSLDVGTLTGSGSITATTTSDLIVSDLLSPGQSPGILNFGGNLTLASTAMTQIELAGTAPGQFDQVIGLNDLALGGNLTVLLDSGFALADGMTFDIFQVNGATTGQFLGLGEGALVGSFGGTDLFITYQGGSGNNVSLYTSAVPEPGHAALVLGIGCLLFPRRRKRDA